MAEFKVGDRVRRTTSHLTWEAMHEGSEWVVAGVEVVGGRVKLTFAGQPPHAVFYGSMYELIEKPAQSRRMEAHKEEYRAAARANDPATSKGNRKVNKYEQAVLDALSLDATMTAGTLIPRGLTGKEIAEACHQPLNCITPRFAPLRRKGKIKALEVPIEWGEQRLVPRYVKRDKQIVWVLV